VRSDAATANCAIDTYLGDNIDGDYAMVEIERAEGHFTLVVDAGFIELARSAERENPDLVEDLTLPRATLRAVVAGWPDEWCSADRHLHVHHSVDHIPHLTLTGSSTTALLTDEDDTRN